MLNRNIWRPFNMEAPLTGHEYHELVVRGGISLWTQPPRPRTLRHGPTGTTATTVISNRLMADFLRMILSGAINFRTTT